MAHYLKIRKENSRVAGPGRESFSCSPHEGSLTRASSKWVKTLSFVNRRSSLSSRHVSLEIHSLGHFRHLFSGIHPACFGPGRELEMDSRGSGDTRIPVTQSEDLYRKSMMGLNDLPLKGSVKNGVRIAVSLEASTL